MALQLTVTTVHGFEAVNAYHRVEAISSDDRARLDFRVRSYKDAEREFPAFGDANYSCPYVLEGANPIQQAYEYLKSLPEFAGAADV